MNDIQRKKVKYLIDELLNGKILYRKHYNDDTRIEYIFQENEIFEIKGWGTAYGNVNDRLVDIISNPNHWEVHMHLLSDGAPYPWSINYIKTT